MKSLLINTRIAVVALITFCGIAFSIPAQANQEKKETPVSLNYLGKFKNQPVFEVTFNNEEESQFIVTILDENKNILYRDIVKSGTASKKYVLNTDEVGDVPLQFEISGKKTKTVVYQVNKNSRVVEDVAINKIN